MLHRRSLELLRKVGVRLYHLEALSQLRKAGALVTDENLVRIQPELVEWALAQVPHRIPPCKRGSRQVIVPLEGRVVSFGTESDCLSYVDPRTGARHPWVTGDINVCVFWWMGTCRKRSKSPCCRRNFPIATSMPCSVSVIGQSGDVLSTGGSSAREVIAVRLARAELHLFQRNAA